MPRNSGPAIDLEGGEHHRPMLVVAGAPTGLERLTQLVYFKGA